MRGEAARSAALPTMRCPPARTEHRRAPASVRQRRPAWPCRRAVCVPRRLSQGCRGSKGRREGARWAARRARASHALRARRRRRVEALAHALLLTWEALLLTALSVACTSHRQRGGADCDFSGAPARRRAAGAAAGRRSGAVWVRELSAGRAHNFKIRGTLRRARRTRHSRKRRPCVCVCVCYRRYAPSTRDRAGAGRRSG